MDSYKKKLLNEPVTISEIDGLPINLFIVEFGYINTIFYTSGKYYKEFNAVGIRIFTNLYKAFAFFKDNEMKILSKAYMSLYNFTDDGDKEILYYRQGGNVGKKIYNEL